MAENESASQHSIARIDELVKRVEALPDPFARAAAVELVQAVMDLHSAALARMLEIVSSSPDGAGTMAGLAGDDLVSSVLAVHELHPEDLEARVHGALEKLQRYFDSRGAGIALVSLDAATVHVRFTGNRRGSGAGARHVIEDVIYEAAPEITNLVIDGVDEPAAAGFVPLSQLVPQPL